MRREKQLKRDIAKAWALSVSLYGLVSVAVLLVLLIKALPEGAQQPVQICTGLLFWIGLLGGSIAYFRLWRKYRETIDKQQPKGKWPSALRFAGNRYGAAADILLIVGIALTVLCGLTRLGGQFLEWLGLFLLVTAIYFHFLLNGRVFQYIITREKRGNEDERTKETS